MCSAMRVPLSGVDDVRARWAARVSARATRRRHRAATRATRRRRNRGTAMPIAEPLRCHLYETGGLLQQCKACDWAQRGHAVELAECPACGTPLTAPLAILFGGLAVVYGGKNFEVHDNGGRRVVIERADYCEAIQFMCRHADDLRNGTIMRDAGPVRRIPKYQNFDDQIRRWSLAR
jgi:hypothetical protein